LLRRSEIFPTAYVPSRACKLGSVSDDEEIVSKAASSVFHTHADIGVVWDQTAFLEALGHSPHTSVAPTHQQATFKAEVRKDDVACNGS
jgi:hypothetical protein